MRRLLLTAIFILVLAMPVSAAIRCGTHLVSIGDPSSKVLEYCGQPTNVTQLYNEHSGSKGGSIWFYEYNNRFMVRFYISYGVVRNIIQGK